MSEQKTTRKAEPYQPRTHEEIFGRMHRVNRPLSLKGYTYRNQKDPKPTEYSLNQFK